MCVWHRSRRREEEKGLVRPGEIFGKFLTYQTCLPDFKCLAEIPVAHVKDFVLTSAVPRA